MEPSRSHHNAEAAPCPDWTAPVIIIGAGRSGSTLLSSVLGEHPDMYMIGETSFLLHRLWACFFERPEYVRNYRLGKLYRQEHADLQDAPWFTFWEKTLGRNLASCSPLLESIERRENSRLAAVLGRAFGELLIPPSLRAPRWGFKEIWNGSDAFPVGWDVYNAAFPNACFVHCIRNPADFARSYFANNRRTPTRDDVIYIFRQWTAMILMSRRQRTTARYCEIRHEDVCRDRAAAAARLFDFLGMPLHARCRAALDVTCLASQGYPVMPRLTLRDIRHIPGLCPLLEELYPQHSLLTCS
jgi:hypothetical protein